MIKKMMAPTWKLVINQSLILSIIQLQEYSLKIDFFDLVIIDLTWHKLA